MWLKVVACTSVVGGCAAIGYILAGNLRRRPEELGALQTALEILHTEIEYATPLTEGMARVASVSRWPAAAILAAAAANLKRGEGAGAGAAWTDAVRGVYPRTALNPGDAGILLTLGSSLGVSHREDQIRHLVICRERLAAAEREAGQAATRNCRLLQHLGVLGGLLLALLFI